MKLCADYRQPIIEALAVLEDAGISCFPVNLYKIEQQYKNLLTLRSYKSFMANKGISREDCFNYFGSEDGAAVSIGNKYIIFYNEQRSKRRIRFTIAHEMGHVFLDHHDKYKKTILKRDGVGEKLYDLLEKEANCFARNLLCPAYHTERLLQAHGISRVARGQESWVRTKETQTTANLRTIFHAETLIENAFEVSTIAAEKRLVFLRTDINKYRGNSIDWKPTSHIQQTASWCCYHCGFERFSGSACCTECGQNHFVYQVRTSSLQYTTTKLNKQNQFSICPVCGVEDYSEEAEFCKICGTPLFNACTHDPAHLNYPESKYCYICGNTTAFYETESHQMVKQRLLQTSEGELSMVYKSEIEYDSETNRINECPRCQNELFSEEAQYCRICGLELVNKCIPEPWYDSNGNPNESYSHENPPDARFCEQCGAPTKYFQEHKLLKRYEELRGLPITEQRKEKNSTVKEPIFAHDIPF
jgi:hypothetical protein